MQKWTKDTQPSTDEVEALLARGEPEAARRALDATAEHLGHEPRMAQQVAQLYMHLKSPARAEEFYARAVALAPDNTDYRYNHSTALIALGRMQEAGAEFDRVIADSPTDWDAWYNRATLCRQTPERNHVAAIRHAMRRPDTDQTATVALNYALAKELEDLGDDEASFAALVRGADARHAMLSYRTEGDVDIMQAITDAFPGGPPDTSREGRHDTRPVFVVGLPRSGTTLVDRILSSHNRIGSHGEGPDFPLSLMRLVGKCANKDELLRRSMELDPATLGKAYMARVGNAPGDRVVDKTPDNFLYLGLIARALPEARIVYVRRRPMDVCYAMYKTLFRTAYPYSYDLSDLSQYWLAFDALMRHWQDGLPSGRLLTVDYEQLVHAPEAVSRRLLEHVGMPWEDACMNFHHNPLPSLTASAAQVRQPIYTSSVGLWRRYRRQLAPLADRLIAAGVPIDESGQVS